MYIRMGFHNARMNLSRTIMAFCVIGAAALIMTASLSLSSGFLQGEHLALRRYLGADIVIFPGKYVFQQGELQGMAGNLSWSHYHEPWRNELSSVLSRLPKDGYLAPAGAPKSINLHELQAAIGKLSDVTNVYPYYGLPAFMALPSQQGILGMPTTLRGRDIDKDTHWDLATLSSSVNWGGGGGGTEGAPPPGGAGGDQPPNPQDEAMQRFLNQLEEFAALDGEMVCMINIGSIPAGTMPPAVGSTITVLVPGFSRLDTDGSYLFDYSDMHQFRLRVVGHAMVPVYYYQIDERLAPYMWTSPAIHIPLQTWQHIATEVGAPLQAEAYSQVGIMLDSTLNATYVAEQLRYKLPGYTVLTAGEITNLISSASSQAGLPVNLDQAFHLMTILITSLIVATNAFLLVMQRRREIAILKSLGASHWNIITLILSEMAALGIFASLCGFLLFRGLFIGSLLRSNISWSVILQTSWEIGSRVVGSLTLAAILFGLLPAAKAARTSVMEVLRDA